MRYELDILPLSPRRVTEDELKAALSNRFGVDGRGPTANTRLVDVETDSADRAPYVHDYGEDLPDSTREAIISTWSGLRYNVEGRGNTTELAAVAVEVARRTDGYIVNLDGLYGLPVGIFTPAEVEAASKAPAAA